jgi:cell division protein FtsQ
MAFEHSFAVYEKIDVETKSSRKIEKGLKRILIIAGIIMFSELIWLFGVSPFIPFSTIEVYEFKGFERDEILHAAGIDNGSSFISTKIYDVKEKLSYHLLVESVIVIKRFPDKLSIFINPREAAAIALANIDSKQVPMYVDRHGVFFKHANASLQNEKLPIISGFENPQLNMRLPAELIPLLESISVIVDSSPELIATISEIRVEHKLWEGFDLVLFPVHSSIKIRIENNLSENMLRYILLMLSVFESSDSKPEEIDFRSSIGSYRIKEQSL